MPALLMSTERFFHPSLLFAATCLSVLGGCTGASGRPLPPPFLDTFGGPSTYYTCGSRSSVHSRAGNGAILLTYRGETEILRERPLNSGKFASLKWQWVSHTLPDAHIAVLTAAKGKRHVLLDECWAGLVEGSPPRLAPAFITSPVEAIAAVLAGVPGVSEKVRASLPPTSVESEPGRFGWDVVVITRGSGVPGIISASCYKVNRSGKVTGAGEVTRSRRTAYDVDLQTCSPQLAERRDP